MLRKRLLGRRTGAGEISSEAAEEPRIVLDARGRVVAANETAFASFPRLELDAPLPDGLFQPAAGEDYEELRAGFTAVVSHELRTPLARLLALLELTSLPDADIGGLVESARLEIEQMKELIDEVLFLSELETRREVVSLGSTPALPLLEEAISGHAESAERAGVTLRAKADDPTLSLPVRPRMLRAVAQNLTENAVRYAGEGATFVLSVTREDGRVVLRAADDGAGVPESELPRLFERFYRADRARASRGTGLGLAIVKHVVTAAGGTIDANGGSGQGLEIVCSFPE